MPHTPAHAGPPDWAKDSTLRTPFSHLWRHDPSMLFLNHGAFGACPGPVLDEQQRLRNLMERSIWDFLIRKAEPLLDLARAALGRFVGAEAHDLAFVRNATSGVNTVLRSLWACGKLGPGVEVVTTNHAYGACREALDYVAGCCGAKVVVAHVPFPIRSPLQIDEAVLAAVTPRTKLAMLDHITSPTTLLFAQAPLIAQLAHAGIETLVDGAHAPGTIALDLRAYGATYYVGNCHKWLCAPKTAAFLHVRRDLQETIRPLVISARAAQKRPDRSRFLMEFDWTGTTDYTAYMSVPHAIEFMGSLLEGGWDELRQANHQLAVEARRLLCTKLSVEPPCPEEMLTSMFALPLPDGNQRGLQVALLEKHRIEGQIVPWPHAPSRLLRGSAQIYNNLAQFERLGDAVKKCLMEEA